MKAEPPSSMPPAPGQRLLDALVARFTARLDWRAIGLGIESALIRLGEAESLGGW